MLKSNRSVCDSHTTYCKILPLYLLVKAKTNLASGHWSQYTENWFNNAIIYEKVHFQSTFVKCPSIYRDFFTIFMCIMAKTSNGPIQNYEC